MGEVVFGRRPPHPESLDRIGSARAGGDRVAIMADGFELGAGLGRRGRERVVGREGRTERRRGGQTGRCGLRRDGVALRQDSLGLGEEFGRLAELPSAHRVADRARKLPGGGLGDDHLVVGPGRRSRVE